MAPFETSPNQYAQAARAASEKAVHRVGELFTEEVASAVGKTAFVATLIVAAPFAVGYDAAKNRIAALRGTSSEQE